MTPLLELASVACSAEPTLRSMSGDVPAVVRFDNLRAEPVALIWLDYDGHRKSYGMGGSRVDARAADLPDSSVDHREPRRCLHRDSYSRLAGATQRRFADPARPSPFNLCSCRVNLHEFRPSYLGRYAEYAPQEGSEPALVDLQRRRLQWGRVLRLVDTELAAAR